MPVIKYKDENGVTHKLPVVAAMDAELSLDSTNGVQNKVITNALNNVDGIQRYAYNMVNLSQDNITHLTFGNTAIEEKETAYSVVFACEPNTTYFIMRSRSNMFKVKTFATMPTIGTSIDNVYNLIDNDGYRFTTTDSDAYVMIEYANTAVADDAMKAFKEMHVCINYPFISFANNTQVHFENILYPTDFGAITIQGIQVRPFGDAIVLKGGPATGSSVLDYFNEDKGTQVQNPSLEPGTYIISVKYVHDYNNDTSVALTSKPYIIMSNGASRTGVKCYNGSIITITQNSACLIELKAGEVYGDVGTYVFVSAEKITDDSPEKMTVKESGHLSSSGYRYQGFPKCSYYNKCFIISSKVSTTSRTPDDTHSDLYGGVELRMYDSNRILIKQKVFTADSFAVTDESPIPLQGELCGLDIVSGFNGFYAVAFGWTTYGDNQHDHFIAELSTRLNINKWRMIPDIDKDFIISGKTMSDTFGDIMCCGYRDNKPYMIISSSYSTSNFYNMTYRYFPISTDENLDFAECDIGYNKNKLYCIAQNVVDGVPTGISVFSTTNLRGGTSSADWTLIHTYEDVNIYCPRLLVIDHNDYLTCVGAQRANDTARNTVLCRIKGNSLNTININTHTRYGGYCSIAQDNGDVYDIVYAMEGLSIVDPSDLEAYTKEISQDDDHCASIYSGVYWERINIKHFMAGRYIDDVETISFDDVTNSINDTNERIDQTNERIDQTNTAIDDVNANIEKIQGEQLDSMYELFAPDMQKWLPAVYSNIPKTYYNSELIETDQFKRYANTAEKYLSAQIQTLESNKMAKFNQYVDIDNFLTGATIPDTVEIEQAYIDDGEGNTIKTNQINLTVKESVASAFHIRLHTNEGVPVTLTQGHKYYFQETSPTNYIRYAIVANGYTQQSITSSQVVLCDADNTYVTLQVVNGVAVRTYSLRLSIIDLTAMFGAGYEPDDLETLELFDKIGDANNGRLDGVLLNEECRYIKGVRKHNQLIYNSLCAEDVGYVSTEAAKGELSWGINSVTTTLTEQYYAKLIFNSGMNAIAANVGDVYLALAECENSSNAYMRVAITDGSINKNYAPLYAYKDESLKRTIIVIDEALNGRPHIASSTKLDIGETMTAKRFYLVNLTQIFGAGNEPTSISDVQVDHIVSYLEGNPEYNAGPLSIDKAYKVEIPSAIRALDGYCEGDPVTGKYNKLDLNTKTFTAYGHYVDGTWVAFAEPQVTDIHSLCPYDVFFNKPYFDYICFVGENDEPIFTKSTIDYLIKNQ